MSGRHLERDLELPARAGDASLCVHPDDVLRLVREHMAFADTPEIVGLEPEYARWKARTSVATTYRLSFADGGEERVTIKAYAGRKPAAIAAAYSPGEHVRRAGRGLQPLARVAERNLCMWCFPSDRVLGAAKVLNTKRTARRLEASGATPEGHVRSATSRATLLRYKHEHRAVFRFDARVKHRDGSKSDCPVGIRALPPDTARTIARARTEFARSAAAGLAPRMLLHEPADGLVYESWSDGTPFQPGDFARAREAGALLARLHACAAPAWARRRSSLAGALRLLALFHDVRDLALAARREDRPTSGVWIHGDFHPDQLCAEAGALRLLDLDALHAGEPEEDVAAWIGEQLGEDPDVSLAQGLGPLVDGYRAAGGRVLDDEELRVCLVRELLARAAASLRRLERSAPDVARRHLDRAREVAARRERAS